MVKHSRPFIRRKVRQPKLQAPYLEAESQLSVIIPCLNESRTITATLIALQPLRRGGHEVILVDGGSSDDSISLAEGLVDQVVRTSRGRALQMNAGARHAWGNTLLFLHADTLLPDDTISQLGNALAQHGWGRFDVRLSGRQLLLRLIERLMNWRSRLSGIATGDQAIFVTREAFERVGGYPEIPLMEDIELSQRLKQEVGPPACIHSRVLTSSRRWESNGIIKTIITMWRMRWRYSRGVPAEQLAREYYPDL